MRNTQKVERPTVAARAAVKAARIAETTGTADGMKKVAVAARTTAWTITSIAWNTTRTADVAANAAAWLALATAWMTEAEAWATAAGRVGGIAEADTAEVAATAAKYIATATGVEQELKHLALCREIRKTFNWTWQD